MPEPPQPDAAARARSAQTLVMVSIIAGPVSLVFGGVLLSLVALICGAVALSRVKALGSESPDGAPSGYLAAVRRQAILGLSLGVVALVLNAVGLVMMWPQYMEIIQGGDIDALMGSQSGSSAASNGSSGSSSSVWG